MQPQTVQLITASQQCDRLSRRVLCAQGTSSNILVRLSNVYSLLRGDTSGIKNEDSAQVWL